MPLNSNKLIVIDLFDRVSILSRNIFQEVQNEKKNSDLNCMFSYRKCHLMKQEAFWEVQWTVPKQPPLEGEPVRKP